MNTSLKKKKTVNEYILMILKLCEFSTFQVQKKTIGILPSSVP